MRVYKDLMGDGSKIDAGEIIVGSDKLLPDALNANTKILPLIDALDSVEKIDNIYDNYSNDLPNYTFYQFLVSKWVAHPVLGGGIWLVEGVKTSPNYEIQETKAYANNGIKYFTRSKMNGVWQPWVQK